MNGEDQRQDIRDYLKVKEDFDSKMAEIDRTERFDASHGVDTSTPFESWEIEEIDEAGLLNNYRYSPSPAATLRKVISATPVTYEDVAFVDLGSGKGRVLLVASEFPFKRIIGVEYSEHLCSIAERNIGQYSSASQKCDVFEIRHEDATKFEIPDDAGVFYFYEPFSPPLAMKVLENIERSLARAPRAAVICMVGRALLAVIEGREPWVPHGPVVTSPDEEYFDARLFTARDSAPGDS